MIIWGTKAREQVVGHGQFFCPHCNETRPYERKRRALYFSIYFIPLIRLKNLGEDVECQVCRSNFDLKVLDVGSQGSLQTVAKARYALLHGTSPSALRTQLVEAGVDAHTADQIIEMAQR